MRDEQKTTMRDLENRVRDEVQEQAHEYLHLDQDASEVQDWLHELVDGHVPIMNASLLECALDDLTVGFPDDFQEAASGTDNVYGVLSRAIYDRLRDRAFEVWAEVHNEDVEAREARRDAGESRYRVLVERTVTLRRTVDVDAPNEESAMAQAKPMAAMIRNDAWREMDSTGVKATDAVNLDELKDRGEPAPEM